MSQPNVTVNVNNGYGPQGGYQQGGYQQGVYPPAVQLPANYSLLKLIFLGLITLGIYPLVIYSRAGEAVNTIASRWDGRRTMHYCLLFFIINPITCGIGMLVWAHRISNRIGNELRRRGHSTNFSASTFWLWNVLGAFILVGPLVYTYKFCAAMNELVSDYNMRG